jgi:acyl-CoA dehydrogenase
MANQNFRSSWITEELQIFRSTVQKFIQKAFVPHQAHWRHQHRPDSAAWTAAGDIGLLLPDLPEAYGGGGGNFAHMAVVIEELAHAGVHFGAGIQSIVARYILAYGSVAQKEKWLPPMARGELVGAIAMTEPSAGSDLQGLRMTARREGEHYVINGSKSFISNGWHAGILCLAVKTDSAASGTRGISLIVVETKGLAGYQVGPLLEKIGMHGQDTCELFFDEVKVPCSNFLGSAEGQGFSQMLTQLPYERLTIALSAVASAEQAVLMTARYAQERMVSGKPLFDFQNTRFKLAECRTESHIGRVFLDNCIERFIAGQLDDSTAAMAKYWLTDCQCRIIDECLQLHGGYGYMTEYPIARMWADSRVQRIYGGANEIMKEMIAWSI